MTTPKDDLLSPSTQPEFPVDQQQESGAWIWWLVWIPITVAIILWVAGWSFGNYGGPWGPKPSSVPPQISAPATITVQIPGQQNFDVTGQ